MKIDSTDLIRKLPAMIQGNKKFAKIDDGGNYHKRARWVHKQEQYQIATCSNCFKITMQERWGEELRYYAFCPNCGARMETDQ